MISFRKPLLYSDSTTPSPTQVDLHNNSCFVGPATGVLPGPLVASPVHVRKKYAQRRYTSCFTIRAKQNRKVTYEVIYHLYPLVLFRLTRQNLSILGGRASAKARRAFTQLCMAAEQPISSWLMPCAVIHRIRLDGLFHGKVQQKMNDLGCFRGTPASGNPM